MARAATLGIPVFARKCTRGRPHTTSPPPGIRANPVSLAAVSGGTIGETGPVRLRLRRPPKSMAQRTANPCYLGHLGNQCPVAHHEEWPPRVPGMHIDDLLRIAMERHASD